MFTVAIAAVRNNSIYTSKFDDHFSGDENHTHTHSEFSQSNSQRKFIYYCNYKTVFVESINPFGYLITWTILTRSHNNNNNNNDNDNTSCTNINHSD